MPTRSSTGKDHDFTTVAERVVEQAIGEQWDGSPLTDKDKERIQLLWRSEGWAARARAAALSPRKRKQIAKKAAEARCGKQ